MSIVEKDLADTIVQLRKRQADDDTEYVPIGQLIAAYEWHLEREQQLRGEKTALAATLAGGDA